MTTWKPWLTPAAQIEDTICEIPISAVKDYWKRLRPDLLETSSSGPGIGTAGNINQRGWRLGVTGYIQQLKMTTEENSSGETVLVNFNALCHAAMLPKEYDVKVNLKVNDGTVDRLNSASCNCIAGKEVGNAAHCKHVLALMYALKTVVDSGVIPTWSVSSTSLEQSWGAGYADSISRPDLRPDRADIYAHFLKPDRRTAWLPDVQSRIHPSFRNFSTPAVTGILTKVAARPDIYPSTLSRLIVPPDIFARLPRMKSKELHNPFSIRAFDWPDCAPRIPLNPVNTLEISRFIY